MHPERSPSKEEPPPSDPNYPGDEPKSTVLWWPAVVHVEKDHVVLFRLVRALALEGTWWAFRPRKKIFPLLLVEILAAPVPPPLLLLLG